jgi:hypothetical protein
MRRRVAGVCPGGLCVAAAVCLAALLLAATAFAAHSSYVLKRPARERCKKDYVRQVRRVKVHGRRVAQVWCVFRTPVVAQLGVGHRGVVGESGATVTVEGSVLEVHGNESSGPPGLTVTFTITDVTTGKRIAAFRWFSGDVCAIAETLNAAHMQETLVGSEIANEILAPISACPLASVIKPAADRAEVIVSFAGDSTYGPSVSEPQPF